MTQHLLQKRFDDRDDAEQAAMDFVDFCRGRAWVITDVGGELSVPTHQTFLEFFAAAQIAKENASSVSLLEVLDPHIRAAEWDVVAQLAVQILGKNVEDGADDFLDLLVSGVSGNAIAGRVNVLTFTARSLAFCCPQA